MVYHTKHLTKRMFGLLEDGGEIIGGDDDGYGLTDQGEEGEPICQNALNGGGLHDVNTEHNSRCREQRVEMFVVSQFDTIVGKVLQSEGAR